MQISWTIQPDQRLTTRLVVADGERVYACFGNAGVFCFDFDGRPVWSQAIKPHVMQYDAGTAASPVLPGDRLLIRGSARIYCIRTTALSVRATRHPQQEGESP